MKRLFTSIWSYLRPVWEGDDNKISIKRLIAITFVVEAVRMLENSRITNDQTLSAFYAILGTVLLLLSIVTVAQLLQARIPQVSTKEFSQTEVKVKEVAENIEKVENK